MKKNLLRIFSVALVVVLCCTCLFACKKDDGEGGKKGKKDALTLDSFAEKMEETKNCTIDMKMTDIPLFGTMTMSMEIDDNVTHTLESLFSDETYEEEVNGKTYTYVKDEDGNWTKTESEIEPDDGTPSEDEMASFLKEENFKLTKEENGVKYYTQKEGADLEGLVDATVELAKDYVIIKGSMTESGMTMGVEYKISKIGTTKVTLPKVG